MARSAVSNNVTTCYTKFNTTQPSLWEEPAPIILHQVMEVHYQGGREEIYCTSGTYRPSDNGEWQNYAGYVGFPVLPENCPLCTKEAQT